MKRVCFCLDVDEDCQVFEYGDDVTDEEIDDDLCDWVSRHVVQPDGHWYLIG